MFYHTSKLKKIPVIVEIIYVKEVRKKINIDIIILLTNEI